MQLFQNVYAISSSHSSPESSFGLYDGSTDKAIPEGQYYFHLGSNFKGYFHNYCTGHGLTQSQKDNAQPLALIQNGVDIPIFGGYVDSHMGHFFIEVMARGIDFRNTNNPIVFMFFRDRNDLPTFKKYCQFFGLSEDRILIIDQPTFIEKIYIPSPQFFITTNRIKEISENSYSYIDENISAEHVPASSFSKDFFETFRRIGHEIQPAENTVDKILYLSRVKFKSKYMFGEQIIHDTLKENGHTVICPEELSWKEVIALTRQHTHIAGRVGTALHFLLFCKEQKKVTYFDTRKNLSHNMYNLEVMLKNDYEYIQLDVEPLQNLKKNDKLVTYSSIVDLLKRLGIKHINSKNIKKYSKIKDRCHKNLSD